MLPSVNTPPPPPPPAKKIGDPDYLPFEMDVVDPNTQGGYRKMLRDGTIVDYDDYGSATAHPDLGGKQMREYIAVRGGFENISEFGKGGYSRQGVFTPEEIHAHTRAFADQAIANARIADRAQNRSERYAAIQRELGR